MKGGITSGVVYPKAACRLAQHYRFRNIGGTSAGAIAAAATAAAELGRATGGFEKLAELPEFLSAPSSSGRGTNLLGFFQPQLKTSRVFRVAMAGLGGGPAICNVIRAALREFSVAAALGACLPLLFIGAALLTTRGWFLGVCLLVGFVLLALGVAGAVAWALAREAMEALAENNFGFCSGMPGLPAEKGSPLALTEWLTDYLNSLAGHPPEGSPLTFFSLWGTREPNVERAINLEMMTTNVTHARPYRLPFRDDADVHENRLFYFRADEFSKLFPQRVVEWMRQNPRPPGSGSNLERRAALRAQGFYPLPDPADLPVVVAVRMSLSFPILLSAVPLYSFDRRRDPDGLTPERCWFSDGGICSNLPIHFFDSPLPRWPTFTINLSDQPEGTPLDFLSKPEFVQSNADGIQEHWNRFEVVERVIEGQTHVHAQIKPPLGRIIGFLFAMIKTMQNWSDTTQSRLPGYRDRIAHVGLTPDEGGLNLNMPPKLIKRLTARGENAADQFIDRFVHGNHEMNWRNQRWIRVRSMIAALEEMGHRIEVACGPSVDNEPDYESSIASTEAPPSYSWENPTQRRMAIRTLRVVRRLARAWKRSENSAAEKAPRPRPELRPKARM
jgi:predicted acylesterase/phospholipase RssA